MCENQYFPCLIHKSITTWVSEIPVQYLGSLEFYLQEIYLTCNCHRCVVLFEKNAEKKSLNWWSRVQLISNNGETLGLPSPCVCISNSNMDKFWVFCFVLFFFSFRQNYFLIGIFDMLIQYCWCWHCLKSVHTWFWYWYIYRESILTTCWLSLKTKTKTKTKKSINFVLFL